MGQQQHHAQSPPIGSRRRAGWNEDHAPAKSLYTAVVELNTPTGYEDSIPSNGFRRSPAQEDCHENYIYHKV